MRRHEPGRCPPRPRRQADTLTLLLTALLAGATPASALQLIDARDGVSVEAILSLREPTRIRVDGAPITDVFGNLHASACGSTTANAAPGATPPPANPAGEVVVECDREKGEIYVRPVGDSPKPVNLFISSAQATYTLVLRKSDTPADTIVIRDRTPRASAQPGAAALPPGPSPHHVRAMKAMLVAMASDRVPPDIRIEELQQPVRLWAEVQFQLMRRYDGRGLVGERYLLLNTSAAPMVLAEQEFDRPDSAAGGQVLGVSIETHQLRPGESTSVFVIRRGGR